MKPPRWRLTGTGDELVLEGARLSVRRAGRARRLFVSGVELVTGGERSDGQPLGASIDARLDAATAARSWARTEIGRLRRLVATLDKVNHNDTEPSAKVTRTIAGQRFRLVEGRRYLACRSSSAERNVTVTVQEMRSSAEEWPVVCTVRGLSRGRADALLLAFNNCGLAGRVWSAS